MYDIYYPHSLFSIPTLRWLKISGLLWSYTLLREDDIDRSQTSAINKLSFSSSTPSTDDFAEILTWPKALREFGFEAWPDDRPAPSRARRLLTLLNPQKGTLEKISFSEEPRHPSLDYHLPYELDTFLALKRAQYSRRMATASFTIH